VSVNEDQEKDFCGGVLLQNTTISKFHTGINAGFNTTINMKDSSFIYITGGNAVYCLNPRSLLMHNCHIYKCESNGVSLKLDNSVTHAKYPHLVSIINNRIQ
jgi:hypothetical protein